MKCIKCDKQADYISPDNLCEEHWLRWWTENQEDDEIQLAPEEVEAYYLEAKGWLEAQGWIHNNVTIFAF